MIIIVASFVPIAAPFRVVLLGARWFAGIVLVVVVLLHEGLHIVHEMCNF